MTPQIGKRLRGFNLTDPYHCFSRTICTRGYFTPEIDSPIQKVLARYQLHNAPTLHTAWRIQQVTHAEFHIWEVLGYELATPTRAAWVQIFGLRLSLRENDSSYCRSTRTSTQRHQHCWLIARISLRKKDMFRTTPSVPIPGRVKSVHLHRLLALLECDGKTLTVPPAAHCSISRESRQLFTPSHF